MVRPLRSRSGFLFSVGLQLGPTLTMTSLGYRGYVPFTTTDIGSGDWTMVADYNFTNRPRHGSIISITAAELAALQAWS